MPAQGEPLKTAVCFPTTSRMEALPAPSRASNVPSTIAPGLPGPADELAFLLDIDGTLLDIA